MKQAREWHSPQIDLALEAQEVASQQGNEQIPGVRSEMDEDSGIRVTRIEITSPQGSQAIGKKQGNYITLEVPGLRNKDTQLQHRVTQTFAREFEQLLKRLGISKQKKALIIGLGNWNVTPDSLGPLVVENITVTRHYFQLMPDQMDEGYREVSAVAPGVLGTTGIETGEIVQGIVQKSKPDFVIAIDALASRALERVNTTIQIADTGIHPGSGLGSKRVGLTKETLGVPCIAIGVPTVVYASTIVNNCIEMMIENVKKQTDNTQYIFGALDALSSEERQAMVREVLNPLGQDLLVTPKEIDQFIEDIANVIAMGLNESLHEAVRPSNAGAYTH